MNKRTWAYILPPYAYEITCPKCGGSHLDWSEFESHVWCYDCEVDFDPGDGVNAGVFSGPIPLRTTNALGCVFDRVNLVTNKVEVMNLDTFEYEEFTEEIRAMLDSPEPHDPYGFDDIRQMRKAIQTGLYRMVDVSRSKYWKANGLKEPMSEMQRK